MKKTSSPTHFRRTSSVRLSKDWLDQIHDAPAAVTGSTSGVGVGAAATGADDEDYPDDEKGGGGGGGAERTLFPPSAKNKEEPTTNDNKDTTVESQAQDDVVVVLDKIAFFPLPNDVPESPITTSNRKRLSSFGGGGVGGGGGDGVVPELPVPVLSTVTSAAEMTATGDDDAAALPAQAEDSANEVISSPNEEPGTLLLNLKDGFDGNDKTSVDDDDDDDGDDDIGRSTHSELTAGGIWEDVPMAGTSVLSALCTSTVSRPSSPPPPIVENFFIRHPSCMYFSLSLALTLVSSFLTFKHARTTTAPDDILGIAQNYRECTEPNKVR